MWACSPCSKRWPSATIATSLRRSKTAFLTAANSVPGTRTHVRTLADRARNHGHNPTLLTKERFDFVTLADVDAAEKRLRERRNGRRSVKCSCRLAFRWPEKA